MKISGHTRPFAVLGHPIGHTLSPIMHNAAFAELKLDAIYLAFDVRPDHLMDVLPAMRRMGFRGVNLTIPLKEVAARGIKVLDETARLFGAVNTVQFADFGMVGHNTDGYGFLKALDEAFGKTVEGDKVFVLGSGGAGRAVSLMAASAGASLITLADIDKDRCLAVAAEIKTSFPNVAVEMANSARDQVKASLAADLVVQATPVGMKKDDKRILGPEAFRAGQRAFDLIYMYPETVFMKAATEGGAKAVNGLGMLLHQGAKAFEIWTDIAPAVETMRKALQDAVYKT
ncbi:MAG: shikimate dehydrogenase [bacterium]